MIALGNPIATVEQPRELLMGGKVVGKIEHTTSLGYHAVIDARAVLGVGERDYDDGIRNGSPLLQGHGATPDAAMADAVARSRAFVERYSQAVAAVAKEVGA